MKRLDRWFRGMLPVLFVALGIAALGIAALGIVAFGIAGVATAAEKPHVCRDLAFGGHAYTVCTVDTRKDRLSLFWRDAAGKPFATFDQLATQLAQSRRALIFGMNAGMFQTDLSPVGLYIQDGEVQHKANTRDGPGNFHMKPNGVFYFGPKDVGVMETDAYLKARLHPEYATQSGPMLVIDGDIHPKIQPDGTSLKVRNGVGAPDTHTAVFAISHDPVSFHDFAVLFRDGLGCANALFLDGTISNLYAPGLGRTMQWLPVGPMLGVTEAIP